MKNARGETLAQIQDRVLGTMGRFMPDVFSVDPDRQASIIIEHLQNFITPNVVRKIRSSLDPDTQAAEAMKCGDQARTAICHVLSPFSDARPQRGRKPEIDRSLVEQLKQRLSWTQVGKRMGRSPMSVQSAYRLGAKKDRKFLTILLELEQILDNALREEAAHTATARPPSQSATRKPVRQRKTKSRR